jgi:hypothetical protein
VDRVRDGGPPDRFDRAGSFRAHRPR